MQRGQFPLTACCPILVGLARRAIDGIAVCDFPTVLYVVREQREMAPQIYERGALVDQLHLDATHVPRVLATALGEVLDGDFPNRGELVAINDALWEVYRLPVGSDLWAGHLIAA